MTGNRMVRNQETQKMEAKNASVDYCPQCTEVMASGGENSRPQPPTVRERKQASISGKVVLDPEDMF